MNVPVCCASNRRGEVRTLTCGRDTLECADSHAVLHSWTRATQNQSQVGSNLQSWGMLSKFFSSLQFGNV